MAAPRLRLDSLSPHLRAALAAQAPAPAARPRKAVKVPKAESPLVARLRLQIRVEGLPEPRTELEFHPSREWRLDLAWPDRMLAVEVDGGVWTRGRHLRPKGYIEDCVKLNSALLLGWRVLRFPGDHVEDGTAIRFLREALANGGGLGLTS